MPRPYYPRRFTFCSLSKYHQGECFFEVPDYNVNVTPCEPRCLREQEVFQPGFIEPSFVRAVHVPIVSQIRGPAGPAKACDEDHDIGGA